MKRGLITWHKDELPAEAFETRLSLAKRVLAERDLSALIVYTDVWKSNWGRYFSNFMPYWNRGLLVIPASNQAGENKPVLLCSLSPRVYPWIKSVTILEDIRPSPNLAQRVFEMAAEKGWKRIGVLDLDGLPYDLYSELKGGGLEAQDVPPQSVRPQPDRWEMAICARAEKLAREILTTELPEAEGMIDHKLVGRLERQFRRAGAEDLVILIANATMSGALSGPAPVTGAILRPDFAVAVALEYRGHWISLAPARVAEIASAHVHYCLSGAGGAEFL
jgi:hypothetical protein